MTRPLWGICHPSTRPAVPGVQMRNIRIPDDAARRPPQTRTSDQPRASGSDNWALEKGISSLLQAARDFSDGIGVCLTLGRKYACGKRFGRIVVEHRHRALQNDRAVIVLMIDEMNRAAALPSARRQHGFMDAMPVHSFSTKRGDQRRMDIDDSVAEILGNQHVLKKARHYRELCAGRAYRVKHRVAKCCIRCIRRTFDDQRWNLCLAGNVEPTCPRIAANHQHDICIKLARTNFLDQITERGSAAGDEHSQLERSHGFTTLTYVRSAAAPTFVSVGETPLRGPRVSSDASVSLRM